VTDGERGDELEELAYRAKENENNFHENRDSFFSYISKYDTTERNSCINNKRI